MPDGQEMTGLATATIDELIGELAVAGEQDPADCQRRAAAPAK
jgi:hypothetical protein